MTQSEKTSRQLQNEINWFQVNCSLQIDLFFEFEDENNGKSEDYFQNFDEKLKKKKLKNIGKPAHSQCNISITQVFADEKKQFSFERDSLKFLYRWFPKVSTDVY